VVINLYTVRLYILWEARFATTKPKKKEKGT